jgi:predicted dehydrogenase
MENEKLKVALVGCGNISRAHITAWNQYKDNAEIVSVVDTDKERAKEVSKKLNCKYSLDYKEIISNVDAVDICTPHHLHHEQAKYALLKGKHVLLEKPMTNKISEAEELISLSEQMDNILMVAYVLRYRKEFQILREQVIGRAWGKPVLCYAHTVEFMEYLPYWIKDHKMFPNGVLFSHGCHYVDLMYWLFGDISSVNCYSAKEIRDDWLGEDTASISMKFENGVIGTFINSWATPQYQCPLKFDVYTENAYFSVEYDQLANRKLIRKDKDGEHILYEFKNENENEMDAFGTQKDMFQQIAHFIKCIETHRKPDTTPDEGLISMKAIFAGMQGEKENKVISMNDITIDTLGEIWRKCDE